MDFLRSNDKKWRRILRGLNKTFYHQTVTTEQIENYMSKMAGINLSKVFDQYLRDIRIPVFEYKAEENNIRYRWNNVVDGFDMPIKVSINGKTKVLNPTTTWKVIYTDTNKNVTIDKNFYVTTKKIE